MWPYALISDKKKKKVKTPASLLTLQKRTDEINGEGKCIAMLDQFFAELQLLTAVIHTEVMKASP